MNGKHNMLRAIDDAMMRLFSPQQTEAELRARLDQQEDEFIARKADEEPSLCAHCMGSGECQYDGTRCPVCSGRGTEKGDNHAR